MRGALENLVGWNPSRSGRGTVPPLIAVFLVGWVIGLFFHPGEPGFSTEPGKLEFNVPVYPNLAERCLKCHNEILSASEREHVHQPFRDGECIRCHDPHASEGEGLLRSDLGDWCMDCHTETFKGVTLSLLHTPVREGQCQDCHEGHASDLPDLLRSTGSELCFSCHDDLRTESSVGFVHEDFQKGACADCHSAHLSFTEKFANGSSRGCLECHGPDTPAMAKAHMGLVDPESSCRECHVPHASNGNALVRDGAHQPMAEGKCKVCHENPEGKAVLHPTLGTGMGELDCLKCHEKIRPASGSTGGHSKQLAGKCLACHTPHASDSGYLLRAETKDLCLQCHPGIRIELIAESVHQPVLEGRCADCHTTHQSEHPALLRDSGEALCQSCHPDDNHKLAHPYGENWVDPRTGKKRRIIDPRSQETLECLSCHSPHGSPFEDLLTHGGGRSLCIQCHTF